MTFSEIGTRLPAQGTIAQQIFWYNRLHRRHVMKPGLPVHECGNGYARKWRMGAVARMASYWKDGMKLGYQGRRFGGRS